VRERAVKIISAITTACGSIPAVVGSVLLIVVWGATGPLFGYSDTWQLVINTTTTILTFVMVFVIQNTQNRDGRAIQVKLDEILQALDSTDSQLVGIEDLSEQQIKTEQARVRERAEGT
jgi:low affinity Fe/Cu permease